MITQISSVNMDAESGNLMEIIDLIYQGGNTKYEGVSKCLKLLNAKAKSMDGIQPCIKQLHTFVIKHYHVRDVQALT